MRYKGGKFANKINHLANLRPLSFLGKMRRQKYFWRMDPLVLGALRREGACKRHLRHLVEHSEDTEVRAVSSYLYYQTSRGEGEGESCPLREAAAEVPCGEDATDLEYIEGAAYISVLRAKFSHGLPARRGAFDKLVATLGQAHETHALRAGFEVLLEYLRSNGEHQVGPIASLIGKKFGNAHYVVRAEIRRVVGELVQLHGPAALDSASWPVHHRLEFMATFCGDQFALDERTVELISDKKKGDILLRILSVIEPAKYLESLHQIYSDPGPGTGAGIDRGLGNVGARNLKALIRKMSGDWRAKSLDTLVSYRSPLSIFYVCEKAELYRDQLRDVYPIHRNECVRVEYLEALAERMALCAEIIARVSAWMSLNQILDGKENMLRASRAMRIFFAKFAKLYLRRWAYLEKERGGGGPSAEDPEVYLAVKMFEKIPETVLSMVEGENCSRIYLGLLYLHGLESARGMGLIVGEDRKRRALGKALTSGYEGIRALAGEFQIHIEGERLLSLLGSRGSSYSSITGMCMSFVNAGGDSARVRPLIKSKLTEYLARTEGGAACAGSVYGVIHLLSRMINRIDRNTSLADSKLRLSVSRRDVAKACQEDAEAKSFFQEVSPLVAAILKANARLLERTTNNALEEGERDALKQGVFTKEEAAEIWRTTREACIFVGLHIIRYEEVLDIHVLLDILLAINHLGITMTVYQSLRNVLTYFDSHEVHRSLIERLFGLLESRDFAVTRRSGGLPLAFKAIANAERNRRDKRATHLIFSGLLQRAFRPGSLQPREEAQANPSLLIHVMNIIREIVSGTAFRYELRSYESTLFSISLLFISHADWKVRNGAFMLFAALARKLFKESANPLPRGIAPGKGGLAAYTKASVPQELRATALSHLEQFAEKRDATGTFALLAFFSRIPQLTEEEKKAVERCARGCSAETPGEERVSRKSLRILGELSGAEAGTVVDFHARIPEHAKAALARYKAWRERGGVIEEGAAPCSGQGCMELEQSALAILGSEDPRVREYSRRELSAPYTYEHALHQLLGLSRCKPCLKRLLEEEAAQAREIEEDAGPFGRERANVFRDIQYELSIIGP